MINISNLPAAKATIFIIVGLFTGILFQANIIVTIIVFVVSAAISIFLFKKYPAFVYAILCLVIGIGLSLRINISQPKFSDKYIKPFNGIIKGEVVKVIKDTHNYKRLLVKGRIRLKFFTNNETKNILLTLIADSMNISIGTRIITGAEISPPGKKYYKEDFDEIQFFRSNNYHWKATAYSSGFAITGHNRNIFYYSEEVASVIKKRLKELFIPELAPVAIAITTGDKSILDYEIKEEFSLTGTAHILAVSGLHVGFISMIVLFFLNYIRNKWVRLLLFSLVIISYLFITGLHASGIRAGAMIILYELIMLIQRRRYPLNVISFVFIIFLLIDPLQIYNIGFQFSFAAVFSILLFYQPLRNTLSVLLNSKWSILEGIKSSLAVTFAASIGVMPLIANYFGMVSFISPIANLLVIPLMTLAFVYTFIAFLFSMIWFDLGSVFTKIAEGLYSLSIYINKLFSSIDYSYLKGDTALFWGIALAVILIYLSSVDSGRKLVFRSFTGALVITLCFFIYNHNPEQEVYPVISDYKYVQAYFYENKDTTVIYLMERKAHQYPSTEFDLMQRLSKIKNTAVLAYDGNCGMAYSDEMKKFSNYKAIEVPVILQNNFINNKLIER